MEHETPQRLFVQLLAKHERRVHAYILGLVGVWSDADDVYQESVLRLWEEFDRFERGTDFLAWAIRVSHFQVLTWRRRQHRSRLVFGEAAIQALADASEEWITRLPDREVALTECLQKLSARHRDLILSCYAEGATVKSVSRQLRRSTEAVYKALQRIRYIIRQCIEQRLSAESPA